MPACLGLHKLRHGVACQVEIAPYFFIDLVDQLLAHLNLLRQVELFDEGCDRQLSLQAAGFPFFLTLGK